MEVESPLVLVVDDNPAILDLTSFVLMHAGYRTETLDCGAKVLQSVVAHRPDLILLDLMMPDMNGFTVLTQLRAHAATKDIPVVILTAADPELGRRAVERYGADAYWRKHEIEPCTLRERVNSVIENHRKYA